MVPPRPAPCCAVLPSAGPLSVQPTYPRRAACSVQGVPCNVQLVTRGVQRATCNVRRAGHNARRATCNVQGAACNVQHAAYNTQLAGYSTRRATYKVQIAPCGLQLAANSTQHAACNMQQTARNMQLATRNMQRAACSKQHATCSLQNATCNMQRNGLQHAPRCALLHAAQIWRRLATFRRLHESAMHFIGANSLCAEPHSAPRTRRAPSACAVGVRRCCRRTGSAWLRARADGAGTTAGMTRSTSSTTRGWTCRSCCVRRGARGHTAIPYGTTGGRAGGSGKSEAAVGWLVGVRMADSGGAGWGKRAVGMFQRLASRGHVNTLHVVVCCMLRAAYGISCCM